jgi:hypothetical protein
VTESEDKESIILQTIITGLHYTLWELKHHNNRNNNRETQKTIKIDATFGSTDVISEKAVNSPLVLQSLFYALHISEYYALFRF